MLILILDGLDEVAEHAELCLELETLLGFVPGINLVTLIVVLLIRKK